MKMGRAISARTKKKKKKNGGRTPKEKKVTIVPVQCVVKERENWAIRGLQSRNYIYSKSN